MKLRTGHAICACGWHGTLGAKTPCPACGRPAIDRMDAARIASLRAVRDRVEAPLDRMMRIRLIAIGVLRPAGKRPPPRPDGQRARPPRREHVLTELGSVVLAAADALDAGRSAFPPGAVCAICTEPCVGDLHQEPLGRGDAMVNVCTSCATVVPRERDHLFGDGGLGRNGGVGEGNRRKGNHL